MTTIRDVSPPCDGAKMTDGQMPPPLPSLTRGVVLCGLIDCLWMKTNRKSFDWTQRITEQRAAARRHTCAKEAAPAANAKRELCARAFVFIMSAHERSTKALFPFALTLGPLPQPDKTHTDTHVTSKRDAETARQEVERLKPEMVPTCDPGFSRWHRLQPKVLPHLSSDLRSPDVNKSV